MNSSQKLAAVVRLLFALLVFSVALGLLFKAASPVGALPPQSPEKSLDINRYPDEPLELIDLKIGQKSVKSGIKLKFKVPGSKNGFDHVKFKEGHDWFKNVKIKLRNVSGRPISEIGASLYFKPSGVRMFFRIPLTPAQPRNLKQRSLQSGEELDLQLDVELSNLMFQQMRDYGVDPNDTEISLSVDAASFSDDLSWNKGVLTQRDPYVPNRWVPVDNATPSPNPSEASRLFQPAGFKLNSLKLNSLKRNSFKPGPNPAQPLLIHCQDGPAGWTGYQCQYDVGPNCWGTWEQQGNGHPGHYSSYSVFSLCSATPDSGFCQTATTNYFLTYDFDCPNPGATPTPPSCLEDGYVYSGDIPCCSGQSYAGLCGPAPSPSPPEPTCWPNGYYYFGITPCCSGYSANGVCEPNPGPAGCIPNGSLQLFGPCCSGYSVNGICAVNPGSPPQTCTQNGFFSFTTPCCSGYSGPDGICAPQPTGGGGPGGGGGDGCYYSDCSCWGDWDCDTFCDWDGYCGWSWLDPILIDVKGDGFEMTDAANGVTFDFFGRGLRRKISWTAAAADDAWLVLDLNRNGNIDSAIEMFSNVSPQTPPPAGVLAIGFVALAEHDKANHGGNSDGVIDKNDQAFQYLRLWQDVNHNGISESSELKSLPELDLESIQLDYKESRRTDRWGNAFRYRTKVYGTKHKDLGKWAYDVVLFTWKPAPGQSTIDLPGSGQRRLWEISVVRPSRLERLGQIDEVRAGKSFLREIAGSSLLW